MSGKPSDSDTFSENPTRSPGQPTTPPPTQPTGKAFGTPRHKKFSSRIITPKDPDYLEQMVKETDDQYRVLDYDTFMDEFVPGKDLAPDSSHLGEAIGILQRRLGAFNWKDPPKESLLYPILVRFIVSIAA